MHQLRINAQGNPQVKNGTGGWTTPIFVGDKFYSSSKHAAKAIKASNSTVSSALAEGKKVKGKDVRRATEVEIRSNLEVESPIVYRVVDGQVEMRGPSGHWKKTVVYNNSVFTVPELAEELEEHQSALYELVRNGGDDEVKPAKAKDMPKDAIRVYPEGGAKRENKASKAAVKREKAKKKAKETAPFIGVRWPNGSVDVRFADGTQFMSRDSDKDLPAEVRKLTRWM
jgi:ribonuclease HI